MQHSSFIKLKYELRWHNNIERDDLYDDWLCELYLHCFISWLVKRSMKKIGIAFLSICTLVLSWCGSSNGNAVTALDYTFTLPTTFQSVSSNSLDQVQITNNIIAAWKSWNDSIVLSESTAAANTNLKQFTQDSQARLWQNLIWYKDWKISAGSFTCNGEKISTYRHTFQQTELQNVNTIMLYYDQLYFMRNKNVYILSLAQKEEKSIFSSILSSLWCTTSTPKF
jgi:hypothetical protein